MLETLSQNIKLYRKGKYTQETLAEKIGVSPQNINNVEGMRRFPRTENLVKIADALGVEVYQLFVPQNHAPITIEETEENALVRRALQSQIFCDVRKSFNKLLDKMENSRDYGVNE